LAAWHVGGIEGEIAVGSTLCLNPKPGLRFGWRTDEIVTNEQLRQTVGPLEREPEPSAIAREQVIVNDHADVRTLLADLGDLELSDNMLL
jgi:hypothetical protein